MLSDESGVEQLAEAITDIDALVALLGGLDARDYDFTTPSPSTHARVVRRAGMKRARTLRDVLGWSLPFQRDRLDPAVFDLLRSAHALADDRGLWKSRLRVARVAGRLFLHSAYPATDKDAVFLGPDSYRYAALLQRELTRASAGLRIVDVGAGAGVGAVVAADLCPDAKVIMTDINPAALALAGAAARSAGHDIDAVLTSALDGVGGPFDLVIANPPYILDSDARAYRDGGDLHGARASLDWSRQALERLAPGGRLILYSGAAIIAGEDRLQTELKAMVRAAGCALHYRELDPDVFGGTLDKPGYEEVERIAVVAAVATRPS